MNIFLSLSILLILCPKTKFYNHSRANFGIFCSTPGIAIGRCMSKSKTTYMLFTGKIINTNYIF